MRWMVQVILMCVAMFTLMTTTPAYANNDNYDPGDQVIVITSTTPGFLIHQTAATKTCIIKYLRITSSVTQDVSIVDSGTALTFQAIAGLTPTDDEIPTAAWGFGRVSTTAGTALVCTFSSGKVTIVIRLKDN